MAKCGTYSGDASRANMGDGERRELQAALRGFATFFAANIGLFVTFLLIISS